MKNFSDSNTKSWTHKLLLQINLDAISASRKEEKKKKNFFELK